MNYYNILMTINNLNATVKIHRSNSNCSIFRVHPNSPIRRFKPGQYGSLGLISNAGDKLIKRAYSISSSIIDIDTEKCRWKWHTSTSAGTWTSADSSKTLDVKLYNINSEY